MCNIVPSPDAEIPINLNMNIDDKVQAHLANIAFVEPLHPAHLGGESADMLLKLSRR